MTTGDWLRCWLDVVQPEISPRTHETYGALALNYLVPALGMLPITKLAEPHIQDAYTGWAAGGRRDGRAGAVSAVTRRHLHRVLHIALGRAVELRIIARNSAAGFKKRFAKVERQELTVLAAEQSAQFLDGIRADKVYWPALLALATAARRGEPSPYAGVTLT